MKKGFSEKTTKILTLLSHGKCAICQRSLVIQKPNNEKEHVAEFAHIESEKVGSKRYNPQMTDIERQSPENIIALCPTCHSTIDKDDITYTVKKLKEIKREHEKLSLSKEINEIDFSCLSTILDYIKNTKNKLKTDVELQVRRISDKINYNRLSDEVKDYITMGLTHSALIKKFINQQSNLDYGFSEKLRQIFVDKYKRLKTSCNDPDEIFYDLWTFAKHNSNDLKNTIAALSVVTYFFQECDIFEK